MNLKKYPNRRLTIIYGIKFRTDDEETKRINDEFAKKRDSELFYFPRKFRMNIYFFDPKEASKVAQYLNSKNDGRHYNVFPTSFESLEKVKRFYEEDKEFKKNAPTMYHKLTGYRLYNSAEDYLEIRKNNEANSEQGR